MVYLLTQDRCPKCDQIKLFLEKALKGKYDAGIEIVHRTTNEQKFMALVQEYKVMQTPCFIAKEEKEVLRNPDFNLVTAFLEKYAKN